MFPQVIWIVTPGTFFLILLAEMLFGGPSKTAAEKAAEKAAEREAKEQRRLAAQPDLVPWRTKALFFLGLFGILAMVLAGRAITGS